MSNQRIQAIHYRGWTYILEALSNGLIHVFQRGSGLQGSMESTGQDCPSWLSPATARDLARRYA